MSTLVSSPFLCDTVNAEGGSGDARVLRQADNPQVLSLESSTAELYNVAKYQLCVYGLPSDARDADLTDYFSQFGPVFSVRVVKVQRDATKQTGVGVVTFVDADSVDHTQAHRPHTLLRQQVMTRRRMPLMDCCAAESMLVSRRVLVTCGLSGDGAEPQGGGDGDTSACCTQTKDDVPQDPNATPTASNTNVKAFKAPNELSLQQYFARFGTIELMRVLHHSADADPLRFLPQSFPRNLAIRQSLTQMLGFPTASSVQQCYLVFNDYDIVDKLMLRDRDHWISGALVCVHPIMLLRGRIATQLRRRFDGIDQYVVMQDSHIQHMKEKWETVIEAKMATPVPFKIRKDKQIVHYWDEGDDSDFEEGDKMRERKRIQMINQRRQSVNAMKIMGPPKPMRQLTIFDLMKPAKAPTQDYSRFKSNYSSFTNNYKKNPNHSNQSYTPSHVEPKNQSNKRGTRIYSEPRLLPQPRSDMSGVFFPPSQKYNPSPYPPAQSMFYGSSPTLVSSLQNWPTSRESYGTTPVQTISPLQPVSNRPPYTNGGGANHQMTNYPLQNHQLAKRSNFFLNSNGKVIPSASDGGVSQLNQPMPVNMYNQPHSPGCGSRCEDQPGGFPLCRSYSQQPLYHGRDKSEAFCNHSYELLPQQLSSPNYHLTQPRQLNALHQVTPPPTMTALNTSPHTHGGAVPGFFPPGKVLAKETASYSSTIVIPRTRSQQDLEKGLVGAIPKPRRSFLLNMGRKCRQVLLVAGIAVTTPTEALEKYFSSWGRLEHVVVADLGQEKAGIFIYNTVDGVDRAQRARPHLLDRHFLHTRRYLPYTGALEEAGVLPTTKVMVECAKVDEDDLRMYLLEFGLVEDMLLDHGSTPAQNAAGHTVTSKSRALVFFDDYDAVDEILLKRPHYLNGQLLTINRHVTVEERLRGQRMLKELEGGKASRLLQAVQYLARENNQ